MNLLHDISPTAQNLRLGVHELWVELIAVILPMPIELISGATTSYSVK